MLKIRLSFLLMIYGLFMVAGLVSIAVMFSIMNYDSTSSLAQRLLQITMNSNVFFVKKSFQDFERLARDLSKTISFLGVSARDISNYSDIHLFRDNWRTLQLNEDSYKYLIETSEMWRNSSNETGRDPDKWYLSACIHKSLKCAFYDPYKNSILEKGEITFPGLGVDEKKMQQYYRNIKFLREINYKIPKKGIWSPMFLIFSDSESETWSIECDNKKVIFLLTYFFCIPNITKSLLPSKDSLKSTTSDSECDHIAVLTVEATHFAYSDINRYQNHSTFIFSLNFVDETEGICDTDYVLKNIKEDFVRNCVSRNTESNDPNYIFSCSSRLLIEGDYITSASNISNRKGIDLILTHIIERHSFFDMYDKSRKISIIISVVVTVVLFLVCVLMRFAICVPIQWICYGMHMASQLSSEKDEELKKVRRYTFITEVGKLYDAYLDLRKALQELKAFVPQGLFVAPAASTKMHYLMRDLFDPNESDSMGGTGDTTTTSLDTSRNIEDDMSAYNEKPTSPSPEALALSGNAMPTEPIVFPTAQKPGLNRIKSGGTPHSVSSLGESKHNLSTRAQGCAERPRIKQKRHKRRKSLHVDPSTTKAGGLSHDEVHITFLPHTEKDLYEDAPGMIPFFQFSETNAALFSNGVQASPSYPHPEAPTRKKSSGMIGVADDAGNYHSEKGRSRDLHLVSSPPLHCDSDQKKDTLFNDTASYTNNLSHSENSTPLLHLNLSSNTRCNKFRLVTCSFIIAAFAYRYVNPDSLEEEVTALMNVVVKEVLSCGGVLELFRPDFMFISFGAHSMLNYHVQMALVCAAKLMQGLSLEQYARTRIVVDSGTLYVGNCGAHERIARVVYGDRLDFGVGLLQYELGLGRVILTDSMARCLPSHIVVPIDYIIPRRNHVHGVQIFELLHPAYRKNKVFREGVMRLRQAFAVAISGHYTNALSIINTGPLHDPILCDAFTKALQYLISLQPQRPRYCRFQLPPFEPLGAVLRERAATYQYEKLSLGEIQATAWREAPPSIHFGFDSMTSNPNLNSAGSAHASQMLSGNDTAEKSKNASGQDKWGFSTSKPHDHSSGNDVLLEKAMPNLVNMQFGIDIGGGDVESIPFTVTDYTGTVWHRLPLPIGRGSFSEVYKAISSSGTVMALKYINLSSQHVQLLDVVSEVNTACKLFNDYIVNYTGWAHVGQYLVIIMDYIGGGSLHSVLSVFPQGMPLQLVKRYAADFLMGLAYLHSHNIVHADIKPQNILVSTDGGCKITDFGSSVKKKTAKANILPRDGCEDNEGVFSLRGTARYMSREVACGDPPTTRSDMWSFGITLYEMLTGKLPWVQKHYKTTGDAGGALPEPERPVATQDIPLPSITRQSDGSELVAIEDGRPLPPMLSSIPEDGMKLPDSKNSKDDLYDLVATDSMSDFRFLQGLAKGTIQVRLLPEDLPSAEAFSLVSSCLREDPKQRLRASDLLDNPFFIF